MGVGAGWQLLLSVLLDAHAADAGVNASPHVPLVLLSAVCCCCVLLYTAVCPLVLLLRLLLSTAVSRGQCMWVV